MARRRPTSCPPEEWEQRTLVARLRAASVAPVASLNGVRLSPGAAAKARAAGMLAGEPDLRIDGHPTRPPVEAIRAAGAALSATHPEVACWLMLGAPAAVYVEMKRQRGGRVEPHQSARHEALRALGDVVIVARGWRDAWAQLRAEGVVR